MCSKSLVRIGGRCTTLKKEVEHPIRSSNMPGGVSIIECQSCMGLEYQFQSSNDDLPNPFFCFVFFSKFTEMHSGSEVKDRLPAISVRNFIALFGTRLVRYNTTD